MTERISMEEFVRNVDLDPKIRQLPDELGLSFPVPLVRRNLMEKKTHIVFFHFYMRREGKGRYGISSPRYRSVFDFDTGKLQKLNKVRSMDFGIKFADDAPIGTYTPPPNLSVDQYNQMKSRLFSLFDRVIPIYERGGPSYTQEETLLIREFRKLFACLAHTPLIPYYNALNPDFFHWLKTL